eukprot:NODE_3831_length_739_cov_5.250000.p8 GENE.NODE_3831_length_739_cov_5.250000~~NODE_3831_length_739_cov_5.250000.p8  ORF type:complete len:53 (+),score=6.70 NODE_3831_length_739_cov_5.250000:156-314(+)
MSKRCILSNPRKRILSVRARWLAPGGCEAECNGANRALLVRSGKRVLSTHAS